MSLSISTLSSTLAALAVVIGLVLLAAKGMQSGRLGRLGGADPRTRRLIVHESLFLDRARRLVVVGCDGRDLLLLTGGDTDVVVGWLLEPAKPAKGQLS